MKASESNLDQGRPSTPDAPSTLRVVQTVPAIAIEASGPSYSVPALCRALARHNVRVELHVIDYGAIPPHVAEGFHLEVHPASHVARALLFSASLKKALARVAVYSDILHNHSLWSMPNVYPGAASRLTDCRLVTSPRGTLSPVALRRSRWKKRLMWALCQKRAIHDSALFHATSTRELEDIRTAGLRAPVAVIPNGVDIPDECLPEVDQEAGRYRRRLLYFGRIHPIKGIPNLIQAWTNVQADHPDWELYIVGPDSGGHLSQLKELAVDLGTQRLIFEGPVYGENKSKLYQKAELYVLPSSTENFGITVAEALAHGVPVVVTKHGPWSAVEDHRCGWSVDFGSAPLVGALQDALACDPEELRTMGERGRDWMRRSFSWDGIATAMTETYTWLLGGGSPPVWVETDSE